jgi:protease-4
MPKNFRHRPLFAQTLPKEVTKPKIEWKILPIVWLALKRMAMVVGFLVLLQIFLFLFIVMPAAMVGGAEETLPDEMVLYLPIDGGLDEVHVAQGFAEAFEDAPLTLKEAVDALEKAATDDRVKGLLVRLKSGQLGLSQAYELEQALQTFKASGKFAHVYSSSYGESGGGLGAYYLISAFEEVWMQPMGIVTIMGLNAEMPFMRDMLDKIGVTPNFFQRKKHKTAYENLTHSKMTAANKEGIERLVGDLRAEILNTVPERLEMEKGAFDKLVDRGLFTAQEAKDAGLITHMDYADVLVGNIKEAVTGDREAGDDLFVTFDAYAEDVLKGQYKRRAGKPSVALIYAVGAIVQSADGGGIPGASGVAAAEDIAPAILEAADDDNIKVIVLRVDSPGGSPVASESILRAVERAQDKGKKVVVSMGGTAASGGYWISAYADQIFVHPTTITGSIGVVGGKFAFGDLFEKIGVNWDGVRWGDNAGIWSADTPFSRGEAERINAMLDAVYDGFITRVSKGRGMDKDAVDKVAGGRVWSGRRAVQVGLADQFGGLNDALDYAAELTGKKSRKDINVIIMPEPKTALERFIELLEGQAMLGRFIQENAGVIDLGREFTGALQQVQRPNDFMVYDSISIH